MKALDRKLSRDLRLMWSQALTIALVVASGIGGFITSLSAVESLELARDRFYSEGRFADVFASVKRAPNALQAVLRDVPGVADVQTTIEHIVRIEIDGLADPIIGQLIGVDPRVPARMNRVSIRNGRTLDGTASTDGRIPALVSAGFADARQLLPGAHVWAQINGKRRQLTIVGIALSPEFVFAGLMGSPDQRGFGVFWLPRDVLAAAYDMDGAFNRVAIKLAPAASERAVVEQVSLRIARYGGREAYGRVDQTSNAMLNAEIKSQRVIGTLLPSIFLGVAAFLLNVVVSRLVATQREQIAALKALGYPNIAIAVHYLKLVLAIVIIGLLIGVPFGDWLGGLFTGLYAESFQFPSFPHVTPAWLIAISVGITVATAVLGTLNAIIATVRLAPAEAMRPPSPGRYRRTLVERLGITSISPAMRMILRNMERRPLRTTLSIGGVAASVAIVVMGNFFRDAIDYLVDSQFNVAMRSDVIVWMTEAVDDSARHELARLPGVIAVESGRDVPVRFVNGHLSQRGQIQGYERQPELRRVIDIDNREASRLEGNGLVMTDRLATKLALRVGDRVRVEVLEGRQRNVDVPLGGDGARDDGPERLHGATGAEPPAGGGRQVVPVFAGSGAWRRTRADRGDEGHAAHRGRFQQGHDVAQHAGDQRTQYPHHQFDPDHFCCRHRGGGGLQQRPHRIGRTHLGAGQFAGAGVHAHRGLGAAAGRDGHRHCNCVAAGHGAGLWPGRADRGADTVGSVLFSGGDPTTHLCHCGAGGADLGCRQRTGGAPAHRPARHGCRAENTRMRTV